MKILILQDFLRSGGTERQAVLLANAFVGAGHATTLLTFRPGGALAATIDSGVAHRALQTVDLGLDWLAPGLIAQVRKVAPEIVLCLGRMANCRAGALQRALPHAAVIATMRTGKTLPWMFRRSLAVVRHIVANSRDARNTLVETHAVPPNRISVIHNSLVFPPAPAAAEATASSRDAFRATQGATRETHVLLCVAMFRPEKNQRELIEIVAGLPRELPWQLWLAGTGPAQAACERHATALKLSDQIRFLGFQRDPSPLYRAADIAVHASASEALSNFLIEAQAHGLPAVAYRAQGIGECFVPGETGWEIPRGDRAAFRATLMRLCGETTTARATRARAAGAFARNAFDPARQVAAYLDLFHSFPVPVLLTPPWQSTLPPRRRELRFCRRFTS